MPATIRYSDNPNEETAFVTQDGGQRNRAVLTAAVDGTIEYPDNPNSTKVFVTVDGVKRRAVAVANISGGGGGGDSHNKGYYATQAALEEAYPTASAGDWAIVGATDTVWVWDTDTSAWVDTDTKGEVTPDMIIVKSTTMPTASTTPAGAVYQYVGATNANYTHGYIYENVATTTYSSTVTFEPATLSSSTIACSGDDFAAFVAQWGSGDITTITHGALTYDQSGGLLVFVGKDAEETTVCTFQLYTQDYQDAGFTITGTLQDGDVFAFTTAITATTSYAWTRVDVQPTPVIPDPLPSQTGQSGKFLTTDGTTASWSDKPLVNNTYDLYKNYSIGIGNTNPIGKYNVVVVGVAAQATGAGAIAIGSEAYAHRSRSLSVGQGTNSNGDDSIAIGTYAQTSAVGAILLNASGSTATNSDGNTVKFANHRGNFEIMSADGTVPTARLTKVNTTGTLAVADWSSNTQTISVTGVTATSVVFVSPVPASASDYASAGILCTAQAANSLTFTCTTTPTNAITVNVVCM